MRRRTRPTTLPHRLGFTLVELLVVIVILALLIGLLVPAVMNAVGKAKEASVAAEIRTLAQALADFNSKYNAYPPSRIVISETGDYNAVTLGTAAPLGQRSITYLRKLWPRMQFNTSGTAGYATGLSAAAGKFYDVNGNGTMDGVYVLTGPECLVLFLGGVPQSTSGGSGWSVTGFSKDPTNPFQAPFVTSNRTVPLFEFNNARLVSNLTNNTTTASGSFPGYIDAMGASNETGVPPFYAYFSAYGGVGYDPDDVNFAEASSDGMIPSVAGAFTAANAIAASGAAGKIIASPAPNPYTSDPPVPTLATGLVNTASLKPPAWINPQSFQIIAAGRDRMFGIGGQYLPNANDRVPFVNAATGYTANSLQTQQANAAVTGQTLGPDARSAEKDNVTNISAGRLD